jgi:hypothetical protein
MLPVVVSAVVFGLIGLGISTWAGKGAAWLCVAGSVTGCLVVLPDMAWAAPGALARIAMLASAAILSACAGSAALLGWTLRHGGLGRSRARDSRRSRNR